MPTGYDKMQMQDGLLLMHLGRLLEQNRQMYHRPLRSRQPYHLQHAEMRLNYRRRSGSGRKRKQLQK